jgi:putative DNA primase/helicase
MGKVSNIPNKPSDIKDVLVDTISKLYPIFKAMRDNEELVYYKDGVYHTGGETYLKDIAVEIYGNSISNHVYREVLFQIQARNYIERTEFDKDPNILNLKNGLLNIKTGEFTAHTDKYYSLVQLPIKYDPDADCPNIDKFFNEVLPCNQDVQLAYEIFGYCLYKSYPIHKAVMLIGEGSNGKSTFLELLRQFLGSNNCASVPLQTLEYDKFAKASLYKKMANIFADLKSQSMSDTGTFKTLTGGDTITAENKFKNPFQFMNYAKLLFSANAPPSSNDDSLAFWRRWIILRFERTFTAGKDADPNIIEKLLPEIPGLLNKAIVALRRVLSTHTFSYNASIEEVTQTYKRASNSVNAFIAECCYFDYNAEIPRSELYEYYIQFCKLNELRIKANMEFGKLLKKAHPGLGMARKNDINYHTGIDVIRIGNSIYLPTKEQYTAQQSLPLE